MKCCFFLTELDFLGHHILAQGVEPQSSKCNKIINWPTPVSATDVCSFLGLVQYIAIFLSKLTDCTVILTPLTTKAVHKDFSTWTDAHDLAFWSIKQLICSTECLTVIDHVNPGNNEIFVTCDTSDWRTGATQGFGPTWETARLLLLILLNSQLLKGVTLSMKRNYSQLCMPSRSGNWI